MRFRLVALIALFVTACSAGDPVKLNRGDPAPAFSAERSTGGMLRYPDDLRGKVVVIRFWADWCRYCEGEMKAIESVYRRHRQRGLEVLALNAGQDRETVLAFMAKINASYPALLDENAAIAKHYGVVGLPTTYMIDRSGVVRAKILGEADETTFERHVRALLE
jgi:cytochrome c biogenesis protein CcmG, thiol:disulfide interchange protein DsbE